MVRVRTDNRKSATPAPPSSNRGNRRSSSHSDDESDAISVPSDVISDREGDIVTIDSSSNEEEERKGQQREESSEDEEEEEEASPPPARKRRWPTPQMAYKTPASQQVSLKFFERFKKQEDSSSSENEDDRPQKKGRSPGTVARIGGGVKRRRSGNSEPSEGDARIKQQGRKESGEEMDEDMVPVVDLTMDSDGTEYDDVPDEEEEEDAASELNRSGFMAPIPEPIPKKRGRGRPPKKKKFVLQSVDSDESEDDAPEEEEDATSELNRSGFVAPIRQNRRKALQPVKKSAGPPIRRQLVTNEIRRLQASSQLQIPRLRFGRLCKEITQSIAREYPHLTAPPNWQSMALTILQTAAEDYLTVLFEDCNCAALHAGRATIFPRDMALVSRLRGPGDVGFRLRPAPNSL